ncbi:MAG: sensor histidine kinase [Chloroflexota bacterium]
MSLFATLRARLLGSYLLVVILSLVAAALALAYLLQGYRDQLTVSQLADVTVPVSAQVRTWLRLGETPDSINGYLRDQVEGTSVRVFLLNRSGLVLQDTAKDAGLRGQQFVLSDTPPTDPRHAQGGRFVATNGRPLLFAIIPIVNLLPRPDVSVPAYVVIAQPEEIGSTLVELVPRLLVAALIAFIAATIIAVAMANSLYRPIRHLRNAAEGMSRGDYNQRVPANGPYELAELATTFNKMAEEVQKARQVLRDFVADVSHELKTPLTTIRGFVQAMGDGTVGDDAGRGKALGIVDAEARRLQGLVAQLLDLSRMEAGQVAMAHVPVPLVEVVERCVEIFALRTIEQGVQVSTNVARGTIVSGDADRLEQLLNNLLDNAIRHSPRGGHVDITAAPGADGLVDLRVCDTGSGIPPEELARIFERFYTTLGGAGGGTGLGLAIARQIARAHGGDIVAAVGAPGSGTTFTVTLPLAPPAGPHPDEDPQPRLRTS